MEQRRLPLEPAITPPSTATFRPTPPPDLSAEDTLIVDYETTGLRWWGGDRPCGVGLGTLDGRYHYLPFGHAGGNLDEAAVVRWLRSDEGLRGKRVVACKANFDGHQSHVLDVDLEELGCTIHDVQHDAALLDDSRRRVNLDSISATHLGDTEQKVKLDLSRGAHVYHAAEIYDYAIQDVSLETRCYLAMRPKIEAEELEEVSALEDSCIFPTMEMERQRVRVDVEKLDRWIVESASDYHRIFLELAALVGFRVEAGSTKSLRRMFAHLNLPVPTREPGDPKYVQGKISYTFEDRYLKKIVHPAVAKLRTAKKLLTLRSKLAALKEDADRSGGFISYALHQLRSDEDGTISGRYSSTCLVDEPEREGVNIQQVGGKKVLSVYREIDPLLLKYNLRELFLPEPGYLWLRADAKQIEYRLFANFAKPPRLLAEYAVNPEVDYHNVVMAMIRLIMSTITRERTKDLNFAMLFGAGVKKIAWMLGLTVSETQSFVDAYVAAFPEAKQVHRRAMEVLEKRGYVKTLSGRRGRFQGRQMINSALSKVIQGSAADQMKSKIAEVYEERKRLGIKMHFTVHDELAISVPDAEAARHIKEILDRQSYDTCVPILWDVKTGRNWAEAA